MSGEESSEFICAHICDRSVSVYVDSAYVPLYAIGGGSVSNSVWASFEMAYVDTDVDLRESLFAPEPSSGSGADFPDVWCIPNTGAGTSVAAFDFGLASVTSVDWGADVRARG